MPRKKLIFIHGCGAKPASDDLHTLWRSALLRGIVRDDNETAPRFDEIESDLLYFADLTTLEVEDYDPALDLENRRECLRELVNLGKSRDFRRRNYDALPGKTALPEFIMDAGSSLGLGRYLVKKRLPELHSYLLGDPWAQNIRKEVKTQLRLALEAGCDVMLIGHCLGSVIAYDALWSLSREDEFKPRISRFVTLGSPLADNGVRARLLGASEKGTRRFPNNLVHWLNVSAEDDYVCHDKTVADDFRKMLEHHLVSGIRDHTVYNMAVRYGRSNAHSSVGYLVHPRMTKILVDWINN